MTAEIAVLNEQGIALAADSAVTTSAKIFTSANKIFALSKFHPVALMVYDTASFHGIPWETIVKQYRRALGDKSFPTLQAHAEDFLEFFNEPQKLFPRESQEQMAAWLVFSLFEAIRDDALWAIKGRIDKGEEPTGQEILEEIEGHIEWHHSRWKTASSRSGLPTGYRDKVRKRHDALVKDAIERVFERVPLSAKARKQLRQLLPWVAAKDLRFERIPTHSGIVIAGFGSEDVFPRLRRFSFEAIICDRLKFVEGEAVDIDPTNRAVIVPLAQREQVDTFMSGIDPRISEQMGHWWLLNIPAVVDELIAHLELPEPKARQVRTMFAKKRAVELVAQYQQSISEFSRQNNVDPIIDIVGMLPKDELAEMAESLVNLTSFKRRVTPAAETVGGPIDVAVISRGDGFIWIKRKHYFSTDLNPHFLANYYRD